jgi:large subunit ribosomal protein L3
MKFILGKKLAMTQVFREDGTVVPVTRVQCNSCQITQIKKGKVNAVQVGFGKTREKTISKSQRGHLKDLDTVKNLRDFKVDEKQLNELNRGAYISIDTFAAGDSVSVTGVSKGKGFQGVVKRHNFKGGPASHGHKDQLRMPGSIGATGPQKVFKGTKMAGRMGGDQITVENLEVIEVRPEENEIYLKGAVPGARNGLLMIKTNEGELKLVSDKKEEEKKDPETKQTEKPNPPAGGEEKKEEIEEEVNPPNPPAGGGGEEPKEEKKEEDKK